MVISTRVLRFADGSSTCIGFGRMESKDACEYIVNNYHGTPLERYTENLVVKLTDSGTRHQPEIGHWQPTLPYNSFGEEEQTFYSFNGLTGVTYSPQGSLLSLYQMGGVYHQGAVTSMNQPDTSSRISLRSTSRILTPSECGLLKQEPSPVPAWNKKWPLSTLTRAGSVGDLKVIYYAEVLL
ncbi:unnamed protein product [Bursaphelenchus okinawaensis]|uniref:RRM domain-containing protein n=1 Tax=Bursaphelenchus okinawaensis TaxID=465554 RepID=A0A811JQJ4_9BILA|nr:unnamed protein product [Bursaphelenchus okinawaensis]CAG9078137.1 unnamed protein product [Bursaphelenchus okinawaensis]